MISLEKLQQRRAILIAQRDQHLANLNVIAGAVAVCDELIAEVIAEQKERIIAELKEHQAEAESGKNEPEPPPAK